ncbi:MAG: riboflavin synthase subunit alpha [Myxococcales bacterium]|nr:riboflavin synthase subunit alpha [Myxococcales bacterium]
MFSGITRGTFEVDRVERSEGLLRYGVVLGPSYIEGLELGASVSIDGVCQTVVAIEGNSAIFEAIDETLRLTTLDALEVGDRVSVERSLRAGDEIGGHEVSGHVRGMGRIVWAEVAGAGRDLRIEVPARWMRFILEKGFVAVDGSSLTVGEIDAAGSFKLHLIPETLRLTRLGEKGVGERVNIELDARTVAIVETVERVLAQRSAAGGS